MAIKEEDDNRRMDPEKLEEEQEREREKSLNLYFPFKLLYAPRETIFHLYMILIQLFSTSTTYLIFPLWNSTSHF